MRVLTHPPIHACGGVVTLYGVKWDQPEENEIAPLPSLVLEYAEFGNLESFFREARDINKVQSASLAADIALALACLHECGVIHGDVKAANVLIFRDWRGDEEGYRAKLSDFGNAIFEADLQGETTYVRGTIPWIAPECCDAIKHSQLKQSEHSWMSALERFTNGHLS